MEGNGTRLMWIPSRSAFRVGTVAANSKAWDADSIGFFSFASGYNSKAKGKYASALGVGTSAIGSYSTAIGDNSTARGISSVALGSYSRAEGVNSLAIGTSANSKGEYSTALGYGTVAKAWGGTSIGVYNDDTDSENAGINENNRIFQIGNGFPGFLGAPAIYSKAMTVLRNGYIGTMNVVNPQANLHLKYAGTNNWDAHLRLQFNETEYGNIVYDDQGLKFRNFGSGDSFYFRNATNGEIATIFETGNMTIAGTLSQSSDRRLKKDIVELKNSTQKLSQINGVNYNWKDNNKDSQLQTGLIAQEVQKIFPELVNKGEDGFLSVNYTGLIPHLIESKKELRKENDALRARLILVEDFLMKKYAEFQTSLTHSFEE